MQASWLLLLLAAVSLQANGEDNPCQDYISFPDLDRRDVNYELSVGEKPLNDFFITNSGVWFGTDGYDIVTSAPPQKRCGTVYPVWIRDPLPENGEETTVTACVRIDTNTCQVSENILVRDCGNVRIYQLKSTKVDQSAYCVGLADPTKRHSQRTTQGRLTVKQVSESGSCLSYGLTEIGKGPELPKSIPGFKVKPTVQVEAVLVGTKSEYKGRCLFSPSTSEVLHYQVLWYANVKMVYTFTPRQWSDQFLENTSLTEAILKARHFESPGFTVQCAVKASYGVGFPPGQSEMSDAKFIGIVIATPSVIVKEGEDVIVHLNLSTPFGCGTENDCSLLVNLMVESDDNVCDPSAMVHSQCGVRIWKRDWQQSHSLTVTGKPTQGYSPKTAVSKLRFRVASYFIPHPFWSMYDVGEVTVQIDKDTRIFQKKVCYAHTDPHMQTTDGRKYEFHHDGVFVFYKNVDLNLEVQIQMLSCRSGHVRCPCGVAVRAGRTVFNINRCNKPNWYINYVMCEDGKDILKVLKKGTTYQIHLPTGSYVEVVPSGRFCNVRLYPSDSDFNKTRGLCGTFTNKCEDDFQLSDGTLSTATGAEANCVQAQGHTRRYYHDFTESWRARTNLFHYNNLEKLEWWTSTFYYCQCDKDDLVGQEPHPEATCSPGPGKVCVYDDRFRPPPSASRECTIMSRSRRAAAFQNEEQISREKRSPSTFSEHIPRPLAMDTNMTEEAATLLCDKLFNNTKTIQVCTHVDGIQQIISDNKENCVLDIMLTGTTDFARDALESAKSQCLQEVALNSSFHEEATPGLPSIFDTLMEMTCTNECSGEGLCENGTCVCNANFGGEDCSIDKSIPPVVYGMIGEGYCDVAIEDCNETAIVGDYFDEFGNMRCRITPFQLSHDGVKTDQGTTYTEPIVESFAEVFCGLPQHRHKRDLSSGHPGSAVASGFNVAVSNYGEVFSKEMVVILFNSQCQTCVIKDDTVLCTFTSKSCTAGAVCVDHGAGHPDNPCYVCDASLPIRTWTAKDGPGCPVLDKEEEPLWIIGAVLGGLVLAAAVVCAVICYRKLRQPQKVGAYDPRQEKNEEGT